MSDEQKMVEVPCYDGTTRLMPVGTQILGQYGSTFFVDEGGWQSAELEVGDGEPFPWSSTSERALKVVVETPVEEFETAPAPLPTTPGSTVVEYRIEGDEPTGWIATLFPDGEWYASRAGMQLVAIDQSLLLRDTHTWGYVFKINDAGKGDGVE